MMQARKIAFVITAMALSLLAFPLVNGLIFVVVVGVCALQGMPYNECME